MKKPMLVTTFEGEDLPHRLMWSIVKEQAALAEERERDWSNASLIAMVFAFHAMEAYLNYVGLRLAPEIWENEREHFLKSGFKGKLREVMDLAGLAWEPSKGPLQTVLGLQKLRNAIAHGKREKLKGSVLHPEARRHLIPPSFCDHSLRQRPKRQKPFTMWRSSATQFRRAQRQNSKPRMCGSARKPFRVRTATVRDRRHRKVARNDPQ